MLANRTPMNRGKGFKRPTYVPPPAPPIRPATRRASYAGDTAAVPKTKAWRNRALLDLARDRDCLLRIPGVCTGIRHTVVAAHSNLAEHGKSMSRKADDAYSCWSCAACHRWLDQGMAPAAVKEAAFMAGHALQVLEWRRIATDPAEPGSARRACQAALAFLNATPLPEGETA